MHVIHVRVRVHITFPTALLFLLLFVPHELNRIEYFYFHPDKPHCTAANPILTFFIIWLAWRYGHIKLGPEDEKPEFSDVTYFAMIFSAGVGVGLFFFGVSEPLWHQTSNYFTEAGYHSQNEIDQWALVITMYHWGFAAWSCYLTVALAAGL